MPENGVTTPTRDMQGIEVYVKNSIPLDLSDNVLDRIDSIGVNTLLVDSELEGALFGTGAKGKAPSVTGNIDDLKKGGLVSVIPNGFLLLHNDLQKLSETEVSGEKSDSSSSKLSFLSDFVKGFAGAAGVAAGAAAAMALFNSGAGTSESLREVISEIDSDLNADDYKDDPEVASVKREAVLGYLKMYYTSQTASLAGETVGSAVSSAVTTFAKNTLTSLFNLLTGAEDSPAATSLESIANTLDSSMDIEELGLGEGGEYRESVVSEKRKATAAYLAAYYVGQVANLVATDAASTFSDVAGELVSGTLRKIYEKLTGKEENTTSLESFASTLDKSMTMEELGLAEGGDHREVVVKEKRVATAAYLATYYASQIANLAATTTASTMSDTASELVGSTLRKIYEKLTGKEENVASLESFASTLDSSLTMEELGLSEGGAYREEVVEEKRKATKSYLAAFYASQVGNLYANKAVDTASDVVAGLVTGIFTKLFSRKANRDDSVSSLETFVTELDTSMTMEDLGLAKGGAYREDVAEEKRKAVSAYLKSYYADQATAAIESLGSTDGIVTGLITKTLDSLFGKAKDSDTASSLIGLVNQLDTDMSADELGLEKGGKNRSSITDVQAEAVISYLKAYYTSQVDSLLDNFDSSSLGTSAATTVTSFFSGLFGKKKDTTTDPFLTSLVEIIDNIGGSIDTAKFTYESNASIREAVDDSVSSYVTAFLEEEKAALIENIDSRALRKAAKEALAGLSLDLKPLASLAFTTPSISDNTATLPTYDDRNILRKIDEVISSIEALSEVLSDTSNNMTIVANAKGYPVEDEFSIV